MKPIVFLFIILVCIICSSSYTNGLTLEEGVTLTYNGTYSYTKLTDSILDEVIINNTGIYFFNISNLHFNLSNSATYKVTNDVQRLTITNTTVSAVSITTPNSIFNSTTATGLQDQTSYTETMGAGTRTFIIGRSSASDPYPTSIDTTITDIDYDYRNNVLTWYQTGTGDTTFTNLAGVKGTKGFFAVSINDVELSKVYSTSTYDMVNAGTFKLFSSPWGLDQCKTINDTMYDNWVYLLSLLGFAIVIVTLFFVMGKVNPEKSTGMTTGFYTAFMVTMAILSIIVIVFAVIINRLLTTGC